MSGNHQQAIAELARAIGALARDEVDEARRIVRAVGDSLADAQPALPGIAAPAPARNASDARKASAAALFTYWQQQCGHQAARFTSERATALLARLREGYTEAEIRKAIDGARHGAYVSTDTGKRYDDVTLICRNGSKLEDFIERGTRATGEIIVDVAPSEGGVEELIAATRRTMATLKREGRLTEYEAAGVELGRLMNQRGSK